MTTIHPPMAPADYQRIIDQRLNPWELTEAEFIGSHLYADWQDIFKPGERGSRYFPLWLRHGLSTEDFWAGWVAYATPLLQAAYANIQTREESTQ
jgi:hypothetical protein